jgi:hypothetical protein
VVGIVVMAIAAGIRWLARAVPSVTGSWRSPVVAWTGRIALFARHC